MASPCLEMPMAVQIKQINSRKAMNNLRSYIKKPANIITVLFFVILLFTVCLPLFSLVRDSFIVHPGEVRDVGAKVNSFTLYHWKTLLAEKLYDYSRITFWKPLFNSILMALLSCIISVGFGGVVAWLITRSDIPGKKFLSTIFVFPYIMPSWSIAMFWENFFKNSRIVACYNQVGMLESITGICVPEWMLYGFFPCAMCLGIHYAPFAYLLIGGILRNMDANLEEAATVLKASRFKILRKVTLPIVMPALISTVLLVFSSSLSSFTVPSFLNKNGSFATVSTTMRSLFTSSSMQGQGFVIAIILRNTRFSVLNVYIDPMMVIMVSVVFIKMPIQSFINAFKEILCVKADDEINDDIYLIVKEIEKEYKFEDSISRVSKIGGELRIEIDFIYNEESKLKDLDQMDCVREEVYDAIKHIDYNKWLNVSFTGDKKWAI